MSLTYWYCNAPLEPSGPHTYPEMVALKNHGIITPQTKISCDGKQYLSVETALGQDFLELGPLKPKPVEVASGIGPVEPEPESDVVPRRTTVKSLIGVSGRTIAYVGMILTMILATWVWDIPHMTPSKARYGSDLCRILLWQYWYPLAGMTSVIVMLAAGMLLGVSYKNETAGRKVSWIHSVLALVAFLVPFTLVVATVLGLIGDFLLSLASIG